jgi:hypothetical protein
MTELEELSNESERAIDFGPNGSDVVDLIDRARRLTAPQVHALAGAAAWQWQPLALPIRGGLVTARSEALAAAKIAGRATASVAAEHEARNAAAGSPGGRSIARRWSCAENGLAAVLIGVIGAIVSASYGWLIVAVGFGLLAVIGSGVLLVYESGRVAQRRLVACVEAAALATVVRELVSPETVQALRGPWSTVMHD